MSVGAGILLISSGAVLVFALTGSPHWLNLRIVGVILILAGVLGLVLPRLARRPRPWSRSLALPDQPGELAPASESALIRQPGGIDDRPPLADEILAGPRDSQV
jgi:hypothetical protein